MSRSPDGKLLLTKMNKGIRVWTEVGDELSTVWYQLINALNFQDGVCKKTINRPRSVESIVWCPGGEGQ